MITVSFTVSSLRPRYLARAVESWARCRGREDARFLFSLEPPPRQFDLGQFVPWARQQLGNVEVMVAPERLWCNRNTFTVLDAAFRDSDFAILAEEDIEVSADALEYFTWASEQYRDRPEVLAACAHVKEAGDGGPGDVFLAPWFSPLGWGTWRDRWRSVLRPRWPVQHRYGWDGHVRDLGASDASRRCAYPALSRSRHFGEDSTMTPRRADGAPNYFHLTAETSCFWSGYGQQDYREARVAGAVLY